MTTTFLWACYVILLCALVVWCVAAVLYGVAAGLNAYTYFRRAIRRWRIARRER